MATLIDKVYSLNIGVQGENNARAIELDMTEWVAAYPDASFYVLFRPYNESEAVPMLSTFEDNILTWTPTLSATAVSGVGYTEVRALDPETGLIRKSRIIPTSVENSVTGADENPPQPYTDWVNRILEAGSDAVKGAAAVAAVSQGEEVAFEIDADGHLNIVYTESGEPQTLDLGPVDAYAIAVVEGYTGTREEWVQAMADAEANGLKAEGYAIGKQNGVAVESGEYFHNNAKYYNEQAQSAKEDAEAAQTAAETAQTAAETAQTSAEASAAEAAQYTSTAVHTWLENNIDPATGYALDRTLTEPLEAAPADMVGDLKSAMRENEKAFFNLAELSTVGAYIKADGSEKSSNTYLTTGYIPVKNGDSITYKICHATTLPIISFYTAESASSFVASSSINGISGYTEGTYSVPADGFVRFTHLKASVGNHAIFNREVPDYIGTTKEAIEIEFATDFSLLGETVENGYIDANGAFTSGNNYRTTGYIPIKNGQTIKYRLSHAVADFPIIAFYAVKDESRFIAGNSVNGINGYSEGTYTSSADGYVRFVYQKNRTLVYAVFNESIPDNVANVIAETNHDLLKTGFSLTKYYAIHAYLKSDGTYTANNSYDLTDYIPIKSGESVKCHIGLASGIPFLCFYDLLKNCDTSKNVVSTGGYNDGIFTADSEGFIRICYNNTYTDSYAVMDEIPDTVIEALREKQIAQKLFPGKKIVNFGDSITGNKRAPNDISTRISELTGATAYNVGFGGCRMAEHTDEHGVITPYDAFSMYKLAYAVANNDFTYQNSIDIDSLGISTEMKEYYRESLATLESLDFSNVDIITIAYGTNDFSGGVPIDNGNNKLDTTTFCGALRYSIETLLTAYPKLRIFICTPTYRFWMNGQHEFIDDSDTHVDSGHILPEFVEAEKNVAQEYHEKLIDNYYELGFNKFSRSAWFPGTDGTHPNNNGTKLIADHIVSEMF